MFLVLIVYYSVFFFSSVICQKFMPYTCECYGSFVEENFNFNKFSGTWYVNRYIVNKFDDETNCIEIDYEQTGTNEYHYWRKVYLNKRIVQEVKGTLWVPYLDLNDGFFQIIYNDDPSTQMTYMVLRTDYRYYAVIWECKNLGSESMHFIWILTKNNTLWKKHYNEVERALKKNRLNLKGVSYLGSNALLCSEEESVYF